MDKTILSNGTGGYSYRPQVAYIDNAKTLWLVNGDGTGRVKLLEDCTGIGSAKRGDVVTGGLVWSPDGSRIACWRDDLSVLTAKADGTDRTMPFKADECEFGPRWAPAQHLEALTLCHQLRNEHIADRLAVFESRSLWPTSPF